MVTWKLGLVTGTFYTIEMDYFAVSETEFLNEILFYKSPELSG